MTGTSGSSAGRDIARDAAAILVIEDNEVNGVLALEMLGELGFAATVVENGRLGFEAASGRAYDLIFMDCQMPEMDGYEATRRLREAGVTAPIVALTGYALAGDREKCLAAGMDDYLTKPFTIARLKGMLDRWLPKGEA